MSVITLSLSFLNTASLSNSITKYQLVKGTLLKLTIFSTPSTSKILKLKSALFSKDLNAALCLFNSSLFL